jgi:uncharacterized membrane protein YphA (DoxX/SURF4 family)
MSNLNKILIFILRIIISLIFFLSASFKVIDQGPTIRYLESLTWLPDNLSSIVVILVICMELMLAIALLIPRTIEISSIISLTMVTIFTFILLTNSTLSGDLDCGCFGSMGPELGIEYSILRNIGIMIVLAIIIKSNNMEK